jgi:hypothetical protein
MFVFSCKRTENNSTFSTINKDSISVKNKNNTIKSVSIAEENKEIEDEECIFDQSTQTDEFLKNIKELENYVWDEENRTATIKLSKTEILKIYRGGCMHFSLSATFVYDRILDLEKDKKLIFDKIIWISLLLDEFDGKDIKEAISNSHFSITKNAENDFHLNFMEGRLYELYYINFNNEDKTTFEIGYYLN